MPTVPDPATTPWSCRSPPTEGNRTSTAPGSPHGPSAPSVVVGIAVVVEVDGGAEGSEAVVSELGESSPPHAAKTTAAKRTNQTLVCRGRGTGGLGDWLPLSERVARASKSPRYLPERNFQLTVTMATHVSLVGTGPGGRWSVLELFEPSSEADATGLDLHSPVTTPFRRSESRSAARTSLGRFHWPGRRHIEGDPRRM